MADRDTGYGSDRDRWRDRHREPGGRADDERRSWSGEDYGRGRYREGGTYGQGAWRGAGQRSLQHEDQRYGSHRDTGETWGQGRSYRDQRGREDFGQYGQTGAGGDYDHDHDHGRERYGPGGPESHRQFGRGGYGEGGGGGGGRAPGDYSSYSGGAFGPGGYGAYPDAHAGGAVGSRHQGGYGQGGGYHGHGQEGHGQHGHGMTLASAHGDFEPDYLHWRNTQMQTLDQDYLRWREERRSKFAKEFDEWRKGQGKPSSTGQMRTAGQGSSGGMSPDQDRSGGLTKPTVDRPAGGDTGQLGGEDKKKT